jgi:hypothetical protein
MGISANELRIGNFVHWCGCPYHISKIDGNIYSIDLNLIATVSVMPGLNNGVSPIPLTEEWLTKFGFEEDAESKSWAILTTLEKFDYQFEVSNKYQEHFQPDFLRIDIKYVHQLQNLYFALTGIELQLTNNQKQ